jgi:toxin-antitoxin system PIN domain toxin
VKIVDLNVLLYAVNRDAPHHTRVRRSWEQLARGEETVGFPWSVLLGFLRLSSNPAVFPRPLDTEFALRKIDTWLALPVARLLAEKPEHWEILRGLLAATGTAGNLTTDAHLAALAISHGAVLVSCDTDFARFPGLRWENPLA